jgi:hypothetical protein
METTVKQILDALSQLPRADWRILDSNERVYLLVLEEGSRRHSTYNYVYRTGTSSVAVISEHNGLFRLRHLESYEYDTIVGLLHSETSTAILMRLNEYDDTVGVRYGSDDVYVVNYDKDSTTVLESQYFGIGYGSPEECLRLAINRKRNWLAVTRTHIFGSPEQWWVTACIFDLADSRIVASSKLSGITAVNSIELPGVADFLIATDKNRRDHVYEVSSGGLRELVRQYPQSRWQVSLSFAGEDRHIAERLAVALKEKGISVFYDRFEKANLLGKDLYQYLFEVYSKNSEYCIVLVSEHYAKKDWPKLELKAMQSTALRTSHEYILPVKLNSTELPGLAPQIGYLDYKQESLESIVNVVVEKVKREKEPNKSINTDKQ